MIEYCLIAMVMTLEMGMVSLTCSAWRMTGQPDHNLNDEILKMIQCQFEQITSQRLVHPKTQDACVRTELGLRRQWESDPLPLRP